MKKTNKYYTLAFLVLIFAAPGIAAFVFYNNPTWLGTARTNKGQLLAHPIALTSVEKKEKWRVILWSSGDCDQNCINQLDMLARMRLALGRKLYLVDQLLLVNKTDAVNSATLANELKARDFKIQMASAVDKQELEQVSSKSQIFIMDPDNYVVLAYDTDVKPGDIYKDLKLLLTTYETKKG